MTEAGALDTSFDGDGKKTFYVGASAGSSSGRAVTIDSSGNIYILGSDKVGSLYTSYLAKLTSSGAFDSSFDGDGKMWLTVNSDTTLPADLILLSDGQLAALVNTKDGAQIRQDERR